MQWKTPWLLLGSCTWPPSNLFSCHRPASANIPAWVNGQEPLSLGRACPVVVLGLRASDGDGHCRNLVDEDKVVCLSKRRLPCCVFSFMTVRPAFQQLQMVRFILSSMILDLKTSPSTISSMAIDFRLRRRVYSRRSHVYSRRSLVYSRRSRVYSRRSRVYSRRSCVYIRRSLFVVGGAHKRGRRTP